MGEWIRKKSNVQNENDNDIDANCETFTIDKNSSNQQYVIHNFRFDCQQKTTNFNYLCPFEFSNKINKINIYCYIFNNEHPQYNTHNLDIFKLPKISQNYKYFHKKIDPTKLCPYNLYFIYIMAYNFNITSHLTISWGMSLNNVYPTFTNLQKIKF